MRQILLLLKWLAGQIRPPVLRQLLDFAEAEIVLPDGPHKGDKFRRHTQPWAGLFLAELGTGRWQRSALLGPTQAGKSLVGYVLLVLYHLFEYAETVVLGVPDMKMGNDKWRRDILPVIKASRFKDLLPRRGQGSRDGEIKDSVTFENGATLKFMTGGGGDASRSGFTSRVVGVTEVDKMDAAGEASRETDKVGQIEARTDSFADKARVYLECTVSIEEGRIWQEYIHGTQSRVACPCPHCLAWVTPEREHLIGWREADTEEDARERARWICPGCGVELTEPQRVEMNRRAMLVHRGQTVNADGRIEGELPKTRTLSCRSNAFNNLFWTAATVAAREWRAARDPDEQNAEKEMQQFVWVQPFKGDAEDVTKLDAQTITRRVVEEPRGRVPADTEYLVTAIDPGKRLAHWITLAIKRDGSTHEVDYGRQEVPGDDMTVERALLLALREFREKICEVGWEADDGPRAPDLVLVDSGEWEDVVYAFARESGPFYLASKAYGATEYHHPVKTSDRVAAIGEQYHESRLPKRLRLIILNGDHYKARLHARLATPIGKPGAMTLHKAEPKEHLSLAKHFVAERPREEFVAGRGRLLRFERLSRNNHWLDCGAYAEAAAQIAADRAARQLAKDKLVGTDADGKPLGWFASRKRRRD